MSWNDSVDSPPYWSTIDNGYVNPYTCRLLRRVDAIIYRLKGKKVRWAGPSSGHLCEDYGTHGVELRTHFPIKLYVVACDLQNKYVWTRKILSI